MPRFVSARLVNRIALVASLALATILVAPSRAQEKGKKKDPAEVMKSLEQLVKDYQDENAALKERVQELERQVETLKQNRTITVTPQPGTANPVPPSWQPFQFNGATYYLVPLSDQQKAATSAAIKTTEPARR